MGKNKQIPAKTQSVVFKFEISTQHATLFRVRLTVEGVGMLHPVLLGIEVDVAPNAGARVEGVRQRLSGTIKRIAIPVVPSSGQGETIKDI